MKDPPNFPINFQPIYNSHVNIFVPPCRLVFKITSAKQQKLNESKVKGRREIYGGNYTKFSAVKQVQATVTVYT